MISEAEIISDYILTHDVLYIIYIKIKLLQEKKRDSATHVNDVKKKNCEHVSCTFPHKIASISPEDAKTLGK